MPDGELVRNWEEFAVGDSAEIRKTITKSDFIGWCSLTGVLDFWQRDHLYNRVTSFKKIIIPDSFIVGILSAAISKVCYGQVCIQQEIQFNGPVFVGDTITARATIVDKADDNHIVKLKAVATNQHGEVVIDGFGWQHIS